MSPRSALPDTIIVSTTSEYTVIDVHIRTESRMINFGVGDLVKIAFDIIVNSAYTDPTTVSVNVMTPSGVKTIYLIADPELIKLSVGKYQLTVDVTMAGEWVILFIGDAPAQGVRECRFNAIASSAI